LVTIREEGRGPVRPDAAGTIKRRIGPARSPGTLYGEKGREGKKKEGEGCLPYNLREGKKRKKGSQTTYKGGDNYRFDMAVWEKKGKRRGASLAVFGGGEKREKEGGRKSQRKEGDVLCCAR